MEVKHDVQEQILKAISEIGTGATITEVEKKVDFERHTLSKYLSFMQAHGLIFHKNYGKAKVWFINKAPIPTILNSLPEKKTFAEKILANLVAALPCGIIIVDKDYRIEFMNQRMKESYGEIETKAFYAEVMGQENPMKLRGISDVIWEKSDSAKMELSDIKGSILSIQATKLINPDKSLSVLLIIEDITAKKRAEEQIKEQKSLLEAEREMLNNAAIVSESDLSGSIIYANDKFCEISKYSRSELIGKNHRIINSKYHSKEFFRNMWRTISSGRVWRGQIKNKAKDGSFYWVDSAIAPVIGKNGRPVKYISIRFDITGFKGSGKKNQNN